MKLTNISHTVDEDKTEQHLNELAESVKAEYKIREEGLQELNKWYPSLVENTMDIIFAIQPDTAITFLNPAFEKITGWLRSEWLGKSYTAFVYPDDLANAAEIFQRVLRGETLTSLPLRILSKSGKYIMTESTLTPETRDGKVISVLGIARDITERKLAEEEIGRALAESNRRQSETLALLESSRAVLEHREFEDAARPIFEYCKQAIGATAGYIALLSEDELQNEVLFLDSGGLPCIVDPSLPMPVRGLRAEAYRSGKPVHHNDFSNSEWVRFMPAGHAELENVLFAPLMIRGKAVGLIGIANKPGGFTENDERLASRFSEIVAIALYNYHNLISLEKSREELRIAHRDLEARVEERTRELGKINEALHAEIAERKRAEKAVQKAHEDLRRLEWLLKKRPESFSKKRKKIYKPPYGNLVELNKSRLLLDSIGENVLFDFAIDFLDLLETSSAVYERNGDYALGMFTSGWCQFLDKTSRNLCDTDDNREALKSGKWHCHESCWKEASKISIEKGEPVDIECRGGIRLYAIPIWAGRKIIGSINFGYGDPPKDLRKLQLIAERYGVSIEELQKLSSEYKSRPFFIIEIAKNRLHTSAKLIGEIVQRKQAEEERERLLEDIQNEQKQVIELAMNLKSERDALEVIMENTEAQLAYLDSEFNFIMVNSAYSKGSGHSKNELIGRNHFDLFPNPENKAIFEKVRESGEAVEYRAKPFEFADQPERGITFWDWTLTPVKDASGRVDRLVLSLMDVTEQIRAVKALERSLTYAESIVDTVRIPIVILDSRLRVMTANQAFYKTFKVSIEETKNKFFYDFCNGTWNIPVLRERLEKVITSSKEIYGYEIEREFPVIGRRSMLLDARRIRRKSIGTKLILLAIEDVTDRKKMEDLRLETERLIYANKSKSEFLNIMGHELRTPLTSIVGYSILLKDHRFGRLNKKQDAYVEGVLASSKHLLDLINNILELGKIEAGKTKLNIEEINIPDVINETLYLFKDKAETNNIVLKTKLDPALDLMKADRLKFKQILFNLIGNAIKFSKKGGGKVIISSKKQGNTARISISDSGIGIRKRDMPRLFQTFEQLDKGLSRKYPGTGLGLAITKQLVEMQNGTINVESKFGKGSTFTFALPISAKKQDDAKKQKEKKARLAK